MAFEQQPLAAVAGDVTSLEVKNLKGYSPMQMFENIAARPSSCKIKVLKLVEVNFDSIDLDRLL